MNPELITEKSAIQKHLTELVSFLSGDVFKNWQKARASRLAETDQTILEFDPVDRKDELEVLKLRGERRLLIDLENQFEDTRKSLEDRLEEIENLLNPNTDKEKQNDN